MRIGLYALNDQAMVMYLAPFCARNDVDAGRQIAAALKDPQLANTPMATNPKDFRLCCVGYFDDETGVLTPDFSVVTSLDNLAQLPS